MIYLQQHPKLHGFLHWFANLVAFVLSTQDQIVAHLNIFPAGSPAPRFIGYALATLSFTDLLLKKANGPDPAAPTVETPSSSAITVVEKIDPKKSI